MGKDNLIDLYSIVYGELDDETGRYEQLCYESDLEGGEETVKEAKGICIYSLNETINRLEKLKNDINNDSMKLLRKKYDIV